MLHLRMTANGKRTMKQRPVWKMIALLALLSGCQHEPEQYAFSNKYQAWAYERNYYNPVGIVQRLQGKRLKDDWQKEYVGTKYCYGTIAEPDCYATPQPHRQNMFIGMQDELQYIYRPQSTAKKESSRDCPPCNNTATPASYTPSGAMADPVPVAATIPPLQRIQVGMPPQVVGDSGSSVSFSSSGSGISGATTPATSLMPQTPVR
jgi:hypothetical protein